MLHRLWKLRNQGFQSFSLSVSKTPFETNNLINNLTGFWIQYCDPGYCRVSGCKMYVLPFIKKNSGNLCWLPEFSCSSLAFLISCLLDGKRCNWYAVESSICGFSVEIGKECRVPDYCSVTVMCPSSSSMSACTASWL